MCIRFNKIDGFIRVCNGTRFLYYYLEVENNDFIYNRIRYRIGVESGITYVIFSNYAKVKVDSYDSLPPEKTNFS